MSEKLKKLIFDVGCGEDLDKEVDEEAVRIFSEKMNDKLSQKRDEGRYGWHDLDITEDLFEMLKEHVNKSAVYVECLECGQHTNEVEEYDPHQLVDIANIAMFIYHHLVTLPQPPGTEQ